ncbi:hypothetical protein QR680_014324 [Steinernema hermaphroditum]|uniref:Uncharacterized protein n=1 Tax=Steinernema hermaphroditum TaxID=289476 RepID=A0AA39I8J8_9BILA|nr:hypothetical protein QR680_014324 [Steinernema hermaphroditum]
MLLLVLAFLSLSQVGDAFYYGKRYYSGLSVNFTVNTHSDLLAGTDSHISFNFGYANKSTHKLLYYYENFKHDYGSFERSGEDKLKGMFGAWQYRDIERACAGDSNTRTEYRTCLSKPNVVFIQMRKNEAVMVDFGKKWKLASIEVTACVDGFFCGRSKFVPANEWFDGVSAYYFRSSKSGEKHRIHKGYPMVGKYYYP